MDYREISLRVGQLAKEVGGKLLAYCAENQLQVESKGQNDFVTQMDRYSEGLLVEGLSALVPEAGFIAEEGTRSDRGERYNWIVDPIDGTTNFIHGVAPYAISIALMEDSQIVVGVVYELNAGELFSASLGGGAFVNGRPISTSKAQGVSQALVATGFPYSNFSFIDEYMASMRYFMQYSHGVRRHGSAATDLAYLAAGRFDAFYEYDLKPYDVAAGCLLITEAGGRVCDFRGGSDYIFGRQIVAAAPGVFSEFAETVKKYLGK